MLAICYYYRCKLIISTTETLDELKSHQSSGCSIFWVSSNESVPGCKFWGLKMSPFFWHMLTHYSNMKHIRISSRTKRFSSSFNHWFLVPFLRLQTLKWSAPPVFSYTVQFGVCVWHRRISQQSEEQKPCPRTSSFGLCAQSQCLDTRTQEDTFSNKEVNKRSTFTLSTPFSFPVHTGPFSEVISTYDI